MLSGTASKELKHCDGDLQRWMDSAAVATEWIYYKRYLQCTSAVATRGDRADEGTTLRPAAPPHPRLHHALPPFPCVRTGCLKWKISAVVLDAFIALLSTTARSGSCIGVQKQDLPSTCSSTWCFLPAVNHRYSDHLIYINCLRFIVILKFAAVLCSPTFRHSAVFCDIQRVPKKLARGEMSWFSCVEKMGCGFASVW
jgi:hypothetical protein